MNHRPDSRRTVLVLTVGTLVAVAVFALAYLLRLTAQEPFSDQVATVATIALLATPALGLVATSIELRHIDRAAAGLAIVVLVILTTASVLALLVPR